MRTLNLLLHRGEDTDLMVTIRVDPVRVAELMALVKPNRLIHVLSNEVEADYAPIPASTPAGFVGDELAERIDETETDLDEVDADTGESYETAGVRTMGLRVYDDFFVLYAYHKHSGEDYESERGVLADLDRAPDDGLAADERVERWALAPFEIAAGLDKLKSDDVLFAAVDAGDDPNGDTVSVQVDRTGRCNGYYADGTFGVARLHRERAEAEDTLLHNAEDADPAETHEWRSVVVGEDGGYRRDAPLAPGGFNVPADKLAEVEPDGHGGWKLTLPGDPLPQGPFDTEADALTKASEQGFSVAG